MNRNPDLSLFLSSLSGEPVARPSLFEPFVVQKLTEQLIWRRGSHLWNTPESYIDMMISLRERTLSDVVFLDSRPYDLTETRAVLTRAEKRLHPLSGLIVLCDNPSAQALSESCSSVCAIGGYGPFLRPGNKPLIRMDGTPEAAIEEGASGFYAPRGGIELWRKYHGKIAICGGLGSSECENNSPVGIHAQIESIAGETNNAGFLPGSGGCISEHHYLQLISLLEGVIRLRA